MLPVRRERRPAGLGVSDCERPVWLQDIDSAAGIALRGEVISDADRNPTCAGAGMKQLELRNVSKVVGRDTHIADVSLTLLPGTLNVLLGPTLSGKTSLMRLMAGLDKPTSALSIPTAWM